MCFIEKECGPRRSNNSNDDNRWDKGMEKSAFYLAYISALECTYKITEYKASTFYRIITRINVAHATLARVRRIIQKLRKTPKNKPILHV